MGTVHEDQLYIFLIISLSVIFRIRNASDKICRERRNTFYVRYRVTKIVTFMRDDVEYTVESAGHIWQHSAWELHAGYLSLKSHTQNMLTLIAFGRQQWLHERASIMPYSALPVLFWRTSTSINNIRLRACVNKVKNSIVIPTCNWVTQQHSRCNNEKKGLRTFGVLWTVTISVSVS